MTDKIAKWAENMLYILRNLFILYCDTFIYYLSYFYFSIILGKEGDALTNAVKWWKPKYKVHIDWKWKTIPPIDFELREDGHRNMKYGPADGIDDTPEDIIMGTKELKDKNMGFVGYLYKVYSWFLCMIVFMVGMSVLRSMYNSLMFLYS